MADGYRVCYEYVSVGCPVLREDGRFETRFDYYDSRTNELLRTEKRVSGGRVVVVRA